MENETKAASTARRVVFNSRQGFNDPLPTIFLYEKRYKMKENEELVLKLVIQEGRKLNFNRLRKLYSIDQITQKLFTKVLRSKGLCYGFSSIKSEGYHPIKKSLKIVGKVKMYDLCESYIIGVCV